MSEPLLNVMKIMLLAGLYLFFVRVLWSVYNEMRDPRTVVRKRSEAVAAGHPDDDVKATLRRAVPAAAGSPGPAGPPTYRAPQPAAAVGQVAVAAPPAVVVGQLMVLEPPTMAGVTYALGNEITLGRAPSNGIVIDDTYVSSVHARIFLMNGSFFVEDLASRNGSLLNGGQMVATTALAPGDRLQVGATTMEFT